ncbi:MAG: hypothetical protein Q4D89_14950 [Arachnia propionica]|uniref:hypothetical protein n=1 Tax=Arachnia propionica TaxID=1750 RepID=UPI00270C4FAC|nr:hypothetical protein [Arachnia propionica]
MHHVVCTVMFVASAFALTRTELHLRHRLRCFRKVQLFCYASSHLGAVANISCLLPAAPELLLRWTPVLSAICIVAQLVLLTLGWTRPRLPMRALPMDALR